MVCSSLLDAAQLLLIDNMQNSEPANKKIYYSIRYNKILEQLKPYEYLADIILSIPYKFIKAENYTDKFGNFQIILRN